MKKYFIKMEKEKIIEDSKSILYIVVLISWLIIFLIFNFIE